MRAYQKGEGEPDTVAATVPDSSSTLCRESGIETTCRFTFQALSSRAPHKNISSSFWWVDVGTWPLAHLSNLLISSPDILRSFNCHMLGYDLQCSVHPPTSTVNVSSVYGFQISICAFIHNKMLSRRSQYLIPSFFDHRFTPHICS